MFAAITTGQWIVIGIFIVGLGCSLTLLIWLVRSLRRERRAAEHASGASGQAAVGPVQHR